MMSALSALSMTCNDCDVINNASRELGVWGIPGMLFATFPLPHSMIHHHGLIFKLTFDKGHRFLLSTVQREQCRCCCRVGAAEIRIRAFVTSLVTQTALC